MMFSLLLPLVLGTGHLSAAERPVPAAEWAYCTSSGKLSGDVAVVYSGTFSAPALLPDIYLKAQFNDYLDARGPGAFRPGGHAFQRRTTSCFQFETEGRARASLTNDIGRTKSRDIRVLHSRFAYVDDR